MTDMPRTFRDSANIGLRRKELHLPHIKPLTMFVRALRKKGIGKIPDFDPWDGGIRAKVLFLYEKPGPKAFESGFISRNNDDLTAEYSFRFFERAKLARKDVCIWNVIPGWNGRIAVTNAELMKGLSCVTGLTRLLPRLKVIVLVGRKAGRARKLIEVELKGMPVIESYHPSPKVRATAPDAWKAIPKAWAKARAYF